jgi:hypothetical protein
VGVGRVLDEAVLALGQEPLQRRLPGDGQVVTGREAHDLGRLLHRGVLEHNHPAAVEDGERRRRGGGGLGHLLGPRGGRLQLLIGADIRVGHQAQGRGGRGTRRWRWREGAVASVRVGRRTANGRGRGSACGRGRANGMRRTRDADERHTKTGLWDGQCRLRECRTRRGRTVERKKADCYCSLNKTLATRYLASRNLSKNVCLSPYISKFIRADTVVNHIRAEVTTIKAHFPFHVISNAVMLILLTINLVCTFFYADVI